LVSPLAPHAKGLLGPVSAQEESVTLRARARGGHEMSTADLSDEAYAQALAQLDALLVAVLQEGSDRMDDLLDLLAETIDPAAMLVHYHDLGLMKRAIVGELARHEPDMYVWYRESDPDVPDFPPRS